MTATPSRSRRTSASRSAGGHEPRAVLEWLRARTDAMADLLMRLARAESPSLDPGSQDAAFAILASELQGLGCETRALRGDGVGDHLYARPAVRRRGRPYQVVLGHLDTVWPLGTIEQMPARRDGDRLFGPGVLDMKGGLVQAVYALAALAAFDLEPEVVPVVLVTSDEEIGSRDSLRWIERLARRADRALIMEAAFGSTGRLKTQRKGTGWFRLTVRGRAAHAGSHPEEGLSAILELSHVIQSLFALNDPGSGVTVNVGQVDGGLRPNVIAPVAQAIVDVRVPTHEAAVELEAAIRALGPVTEGVTIEIEGRMMRPPMEPTRRNRRLWREAQRAGRALGLELEEASVGGASDGNYTSRHTATLDGLGPIGEGAHAQHEHLVVPYLPERTALLAELLLAPPLERR
jgi:glutamate carboxypeptidase